MDDWQKKYYQNRQNGMNPISQPPNHNLPLSVPRTNTGEDIDVGSMLQQRIMAAQAMGGMNQQNTNGFLPRDFKPQINQGPKKVNLRPGSKFYREVSTGGFGSQIPIVKEGGIIPNNASSQNVFLKQEIKAFIVDGMQSVDFSKITENMDKMVELCKVEIPLVGTILVFRDSIIESNENVGRQILRG